MSCLSTFNTPMVFDILHVKLICAVKRFPYTYSKVFPEKLNFLQVDVHK